MEEKRHLSPFFSLFQKDTRWFKPNYFCLLCSVPVVESEVQKNGQGSISVKNDMLLSQNYLFSLLNSNPRKASKTLKYSKGIKLNQRGRQWEQITIRGAGLKGKNGPMNYLTEI